MILALLVAAAHADARPDSLDTFGDALAQATRAVTWSGYADLALRADASGGLTFDVGHVNPILGARLGERTYAEFELEYEHAGSVVTVEYAFLDWRASRAFTLRAGRFLVPIGTFNDRLHPSFRWQQVSRPAMAWRVVPAVWSDVGVELFGDLDLAPSTVLSWAAYVGNGLGGELDPTDADAVRDLRDNAVDDNRDKGVGGRLTVRHFAGAARLRLDLSGTTGAVAPDGGDRVSILDAAAELGLGVPTLRAEAARSLVDGVRWMDGAYVQGSLLLGRWEPALRWDLTRPGPLVSAGEGAAPLDRLVGSVKVVLEPQWNVRAEAGWDARSSRFAEASIMSAFFF